MGEVKTIKSGYGWAVYNRVLDAGHVCLNVSDVDIDIHTEGDSKNIIIRFPEKLALSIGIIKEGEEYIIDDPRKAHDQVESLIDTIKANRKFNKE